MEQVILKEALQIVSGLGALAIAIHFFKALLSCGLNRPGALADAFEAFIVIAALLALAASADSIASHIIALLRAI